MPENESRSSVDVLVSEHEHQSSASTLTLPQRQVQQTSFQAQSAFPLDEPQNGSGHYQPTGNDLTLPARANSNSDVIVEAQLIDLIWRDDDAQGQNATSGRSLLYTCIYPHTAQNVAASPFSVFAFIIFQFSDGRTAECAAAPWLHMVESLLLHDYSAQSTTLSPTATSWCELRVACAATGLHTGVQRHSAFRLSIQPTVTTLCHHKFRFAMSQTMQCQLHSLKWPRSSHSLSSSSAGLDCSSHATAALLHLTS